MSENPIAIYLAGKIKKVHEKPNESYWSEKDLQSMQELLKPYQVSFLNPAIRSDDLLLQKSVFGRDILQVLSADFVFVDARDRRGLGVGAEMMWAKINNIPVISLAPMDTHYHLSETSVLGVAVKDWVHPFVENLSDLVTGSLEHGTQWMKQHMETPYEIKSAAFLHETMQFYKDRQFDKDLPMKDLVQDHAEIRKRVETLSRNEEIIV